MHILQVTHLIDYWGLFRPNIVTVTKRSLRSLNIYSYTNLGCGHFSGWLGFGGAIVRCDNMVSWDKLLDSQYKWQT